MQATTTLTSQAVSEWVRLFPLQATETYTSSVTFIKQLTVVALSTITYLRNVFPEDSYTAETFGGIRLRILKKKCKHELPQFVSTALTQAFEAFDKKYLHQLVICFYDGECKVENLIEYHIFEYSYNSDDVTMKVNSKHRDGSTKSTRYSFSNVRERVLHLIRACVVVTETSQTVIPSSYDLSLRLYYNEDAPEGYQAPGFQEAEEGQDHLEPTLSDIVTLGCVDTPYHKLTARTYIKEPMESSNEANPTQNPPELSNNNEDDFDMCNGVRCPCNRSDQDPAHALLTCVYCNKQQHGACFGVARSAAPLRQHCCASCADEDRSRSATDARLAALTAQKRECLCIFRRALEWCSGLTSVSAHSLSEQLSLSPSTAARLLRLLHSHHLLDASPDYDLVTPRKIIHEQLEKVISKFFNNGEQNEDIVDRLISETTSQSQPDPVGDVLSPMERVSLENASAFSKVMEPVVVLTAVEDATMKQYKEVVMAGDAEEAGLPLSGTHNPVNVEGIGRGNKRKSGRKTGVKTKRSKPN